MNPTPRKYRGPIAWMTGNSIAANLLMLALIIGGAVSALQVKQEVFPDFTIDVVNISVPYPGASPEEVEKGIIIATEEAVRGLEGVKKVTSNAGEGRGYVSVEMRANTDLDRALQDVKNAVDRITTYPQEAERPTVSIVENRNRVMTIAASGPFDEATLRATAERIRDELSSLPGITQVQLGAAKPLEISIEIPSNTLRTYGLTPDEVARKIRQAAVELPAGSLKTSAGEVLVRTTERRDYGTEFADIPIITQTGGTTVRLGDLATITDGFGDVDLENIVDGQPAATIEVFRVGTETPLSVSAETRAYIDTLIPELPEGMKLTILRDDSVVYMDRMNLLLRNAGLGLILVLLMLGLFLEPRLAFWVTLGIPISILGSFLFLPFTDASINMISLFAFIVTLGIIVDDAIVVGENIYEKRESGMPAMQAAIEGAREIAAPVTFAIMTNIVAFMPMLFVPGASGKLFLQIPAVAISVFIISLVESLFILPCHLSHSPRRTLFWRIVSMPSEYFGKGLHWCIQQLYGPVVRAATREKYLTLSIGAAMLILCIGVVAGGRIPFSFLPSIADDSVTVNARLPVGVPVERTVLVQEKLLAGLAQAIEESGGIEIVENIQSVLGGQIAEMGPMASRGSGGGGNLLAIKVEMVPEAQRNISADELGRKWRAAAGEIAGLETISYKTEIGRPSGAAIDIELSHRNPEILDAASIALAESLRSFTGVIDIDSGVAVGKPQLNYELTPEARSLGLTSTDLARQTRGYFYGSEALRQQRGRNEVRVMVRLPEHERKTLHTVENLLIRTPGGVEIPLAEAVTTEEGRAYTSINRNNGQRVNSVTADIDDEAANGNLVAEQVTSEILPVLTRQYPGLTWALEGEQSEQNDSLGSLAVGFGYALFGIYSLLAIAFRSWVQPLIVMSAIPFGVIGAVIGHLLLGYGLSMISMFGIVALSGVVVNDSLVLVVTANRLRTANPGMKPLEAVCLAGQRRFRPIILTSVTTFCGLMPMVFETSIQAKFLIPMAISIAFGVLFATFIILLIVPALYLLLEDARSLVNRIFFSDEGEHVTRGPSNPAQDAFSATRIND